MYLLQIILSFVFFIYFFKLTLILVSGHDKILKVLNEHLKEKDEKPISSFQLYLISGISAYLTLYFFLYPNQNLLNMNSFFINISMGY